MLACFTSGQELALGDGGLGEVGVGAVDQSLEHDVAIQGDVPGEVDPAHTTKDDATAHLVLVRHHVAGLSLGLKSYGVPQTLQKPFSRAMTSHVPPHFAQPSRGVPVYSCV